jgi:glutathione S-transferase
VAPTLARLYDLPPALLRKSTTCVCIVRRMTILLHTSPTQPWGSPGLSPFAVKLETYLKAKGLPYKKAPLDLRKGKLPYVTLENGALMGDSQLIMEHFESTNPPPLDAHLTDAQKAVGRALQRMLDEAYYFILMYTRWFEEASWEHQKIEFAKVLPGPARMFLPLIRRGTRKRLHTQGTSRHTPAEVMAMGVRDLEAASKILADTPFLFGDTFTTYDTSLFAFVDGTAVFPRDAAPKQFVESSNLNAYRQRVRAKYFA